MLSSLLAGAEITFDLLWALYVPRKTILHLNCPTTSEPRACRLLSAERCQKADMMGGSIAADLAGLTFGFGLGGGGQSTDNSKQLWRLIVEHLETDINPQGVRFGYAPLTSVIEIPGFSGTKQIKDLGIYPLQYYPGPGGPEGLKARLVERGRRWATLAGGVHHLAYKNIAYQWKKTASGYFLDKYSVRIHRGLLPSQLSLTGLSFVQVDSRIMLDRSMLIFALSEYVLTAFQRASRSLCRRTTRCHM